MKPIFGKIENPDHSFLLIKWTDKPNPKFLWHFHHAFELNLVVKGAGMRFIGDHLGHYSAGDLVLMGAELPHTWCSDPALPQRKGVYQRLPSSLITISSAIPCWLILNGTTFAH